MKIKNKIIAVIACPRTASTTLVEKIGNIKYVKSLGETYNKDPRGTFRMEAMNRNSYVDLDIIEHCISGMHNIKPSDVLIMKIFGDQISEDEIEVLINSYLDISIVFCKRDIVDAYKSLVKSQLTGNWGTTPDKQRTMAKELKEHTWKPDSYKYITSFNDYVVINDKWYSKLVESCVNYEIKTAKRWFCDIIKDDFSVDDLFKELGIYNILSDLTIEDVDKKKYIKFYSDFARPGRETAGVNDRMHLLRLMLHIANQNNLTLIVPEFKLAEKHNSGMRLDTQFKDFFDMDSIQYDGVHLPVLFDDDDIDDDEILHVHVETWSHLRSKCNDCDLCNISQDILKIDFSKDIKSIGDEIIQKHFGDINTIAHIRRTDRLEVGNGWITPEVYNIITDADNVVKTLDRKVSKPNVYVMTDAILGDDPLIDDLMNNTSGYTFKFYHDIPKLLELKKENNYILYSVEKYISEKLNSMYLDTWDYHKTFDLEKDEI